jgi:hypothetical protein
MRSVPMAELLGLLIAWSVFPWVQVRVFPIVLQLIYS